MKIHHGLNDINITNPVVTIGSFDGVHRGHVRVLEGLKRSARELSGESVIITFEPHPRELLYPREKRPGLLTTLNEKIKILTLCGIDHLVIIKFTEALAEMSYDYFVKNILVDRLGIKALVVGYDHRFGKNREGNFKTLLELADRYHFHVKQEEVYMQDEISVSSTKIRTAMELGDIETVNKLLGYPYEISGKVIHGEKIGRSIGFPTANIQVDDERKLFPATGVYAVRVYVKESKYTGMMNIGVRPTVSSSGKCRPEVHIFDFTGDLYGEEISLSLVDRIRGERKFDTMDELRIQLEKDLLEAQRIFSM